MCLYVAKGRAQEPHLGSFYLLELVHRNPQIISVLEMLVFKSRNKHLTPKISKPSLQDAGLWTVCVLGLVLARVNFP